MATIERHVIELTARDRVSQTFKDISREARNAGDATEDAGRRGQRATQDWAGAAAAVGAALGLVIGAAIKLANESEEAQARLEQSIENTGGSYEELEGQIKAATDAALEFGFDDEDALNALNELTNATGDAEEALYLLGIAEDVARGRGISLADATKIVIAAEQGRIGTLNRIGIELDGTASKQERLADLQSRYAGQAEQYADTNAAAWDRMGNDIENSIEGVGDVLNDLLVPILAFRGAWPAIKLGGTSLAALVKTAGGVSALAGALGTVGTVTAALATPVAIATYLFIDQKNVVARATEETLRNKQVLEDYVQYLESIETPAEFIPEMTQDMKELLDFVTKAGDGVDTGLLSIGESTQFFSTNLGALDDTIRQLNPENLQVVMDLASQLGIVFTDPSTWTPDAINTLSYAIVNLANNQLFLDQNTAAAQMAIVNQGGAFQASIGQIEGFSSAAYDAAVANAKLTNEIAALGRSLRDANPGAVLDRTFGAIVGYTDGVVGSIEAVTTWAEELGISTTATDDLARAQAAALEIQKAQLPLIEAQTDATADYLESLAALPAEEQALALAWADQDISTRANDILAMAGNYDQMNEAQKKAFEATVEGAAAADPLLASILESVGLITVTDGEVQLNYDQVGGANDAMGELTDAINNFAEIIAEAFGIEIDDSDVSGASTLLDVIAGQMNALNGKTATVYVNRQVIGFTEDIGFQLGGVTGWGGDAAALGMSGRGNVALVGEAGPELVYLPGGSRVEPNSSSKYKMGKGGGDIVINGPITIMANDVQSFTRQLRQSSVVLERR